RLPGGSTADFRQATGVTLPALRMAAPFVLVGETDVPEPEYGGAPLGCQRDLHRGRARRHGRMTVPAPAHHQPARRLDLLVLADRDVHPVHVDAIPAARPGVELG